MQQIDFLEFDVNLWEEIKKNLVEIEGEQVIGYEIRQLRAEETRLDNDLDRLYEDYKKQIVDEKFFIDKQSKIRARQDEIKGRLEELEEEKEFWDEKVGKLVKIIDGIKNFKEKFLQFDEDRRAQMLRLMTKKIVADSDRIKIAKRDYDKRHGIKRRKDFKKVTVIRNDEFDELFELGVIKKFKEWEKEPDNVPRVGPPNGGIHPKLLKNTKKNYLVVKKKH